MVDVIRAHAREINGFVQNGLSTLMHRAREPFSVRYQSAVEEPAASQNRLE